MEESKTQKMLLLIQHYIDNFEHKKLLEKNKSHNLGIIYTPNQIVDYMVSNIFRMFFKNFINSEVEIKNSSNLERFILSIIKNQKIKAKLHKKIKNIRILDPSCGSGRFLISIAEQLYKVYRILEPKISDFDLKKKIIENNLFGIEIENSAIIVSKLRLIKWFLSNNINNLRFQNVRLKILEHINFDNIIKTFDLIFNISNLDFLLEFNSDKFDIIIGNPPYVENKKIKDTEYKKKLNKRFKSAYRLFDLSIVFIERSLELLENNGYLSFILPNKFLSADYAVKIRELLLDKSEIKEIINISSLQIFRDIATYPIILSLKKDDQGVGHDIIIKVFNNINDLIESNRIKIIKFHQNLINKFPSQVIPISGNIKLITYLFNNFKTFAESIKDLKIIYRPFGFLKYKRHFDNITEKLQSEKDLILIGTGNIEKYYVKFKKRIKIAGKDINISYFNYHPNFENIWNDLDSEKLIFREIARNLTCYYDPGVFTNITGLYFIKIASFNTDQLFSLLTILNSEIMDSVFKTLFSTLHMAGGYLRFNGSFIKKLPIPNKFPFILSQMGKFLQLLSQLKYDLKSNKPDIIKYSGLEIVGDKYFNDIDSYLTFFDQLSNSLVKLLFLDEFYLKCNLNYNLLRELIDLKRDSDNVQYKFFIPEFEVENYSIYTLNELDSILTKISNFFNQLHNNKRLLNQLNHIINNKFI